MARLQILELPEGTGDDRPPYVLVVDQAPADEPRSEALRRDLADNDIAARIGARGVLVFEDTIDIPTSEVPLDENGHPLFLKVHIEGEFEKFREQVELEILAAQAKVTRAVQRASRLATEESTGRPTHPDGTPYNYSEIIAEGWEHCDGCRTWGQWTAEKPHDCINTQAMSATPDA
jgi:hypothetical protein